MRRFCVCWGVAPSFLVLGVVGVLSGGRALGAATYTVSGESDIDFNLSPYQFVEGAIGGTSSVPISQSKDADYDSTYPAAHHYDLDLYAAADAGGAHVSTVSNILYTYAQSSSDYYDKYVAQDSATVTLDDVVIGGPSNVTSVSTAIHMHVDGSLTASAQLNGGSQGTSASTSVDAELKFGSTSIGSGTAGASAANNSTPVASSSGWLSGFDGSMDITSSVFTAPVNTPFSITFSLSADSTTMMNEDDTDLLIANTDFGDTFGFASDEPVFNLPSGYTADSTEGAIVGNEFVGAVPEPGSIAALGVVFVVGITGRKRPG